MLKKSELKGKFAETLAFLYLTVKGYKVLDRNNTKGGIEGDLIAKKGDYVALVEVKWRKNYEKAHYAVSPHQQKRLKTKLVQMSKLYPNAFLRIDVVLICPTPPFIQHLENTFSL